VPRRAEFRRNKRNINDLRKRGVQVGFELFTGSGFHLHRANESVLHRYWDAVTSNATRPKSRNMGDFLVEMKQQNVGDPRVVSALKDLKDLHRNPLIHPEHSIETVDEAVALMNGVQNVMVHMLREIPPAFPPAPGLSAIPLPAAG
jgi:hypothetical protein